MMMPLMLMIATMMMMMVIVMTTANMVLTANRVVVMVMLMTTTIIIITIIAINNQHHHHHRHHEQQYHRNHKHRDHEHHHPGAGGLLRSHCRGWASGREKRTPCRDLEHNTFRDGTHLAKTDFAPTPSDFMSHWQGGGGALCRPEGDGGNSFGLKGDIARGAFFA